METTAFSEGKSVVKYLAKCTNFAPAEGSLTSCVTVNVVFEGIVILKKPF